MSDKASSRQVKVDLDGLRGVAIATQQQVDLELAPGFARCNALIQHDAKFGHESPSGYAYAARFRLITSLSRHRANGAQYIAGARALSAAIDEILTRFKHADQLSSAQVEAVQKIVRSTAAQSMPLQQRDDNPHQRGEIA